MAVKIHSVAAQSPAANAGVQSGEELLRINGQEIFDGLDYEFHTAGAQLVLQLSCNGRQREVTVHKDEYQPLGCEFASYLIDAQHGCKNGCIFCFIDQLPKGLRPSLYFKDDDERLGFLFGNYITLTNLSQRELQRIIDMRFSPVNISVHTVDPQLRVKMMKNKHAGTALQAIPKLAKAGIEMNFQLVLVPGVNDGEHLKQSIEWLAEFAPQTQSIAAVPIGLTKHRSGLEPIEPYTQSAAAAQLQIMLQAGDKLLCTKQSRLIYPADEWFLLAGVPIPDEDFYEGYAQLENGVGMWRLLHSEFMQALQDHENESAGNTPTHIATGVLAAPLMQQLANEFAKAFKAQPPQVHAVSNDFFGHNITVAGLLCGCDIIAQLKDKVRGGRLLITCDMLRAEGDMMLDGTTPSDLQKALEAQVVVVPKGGEELLFAMLGD